MKKTFSILLFLILLYCCYVIYMDHFSCIPSYSVTKCEDDKKYNIGLSLCWNWFYRNMESCSLSIKDAERNVLHYYEKQVEWSDNRPRMVGVGFPCIKFDARYKYMLSLCNNDDNVLWKCDVTGLIRKSASLRQH